MPDNHFQYQLFGDEGKTGNFEITVFTTADLSDEGKFVFSKQATKKFPHADADMMETLVTAMTEASAWTSDKFWFSYISIGCLKLTKTTL